MKIIEFLTAFVAWVQIVASPLIVGFVIGFLVYNKYPSEKGLFGGIAIAVLGFIIGIIWATRTWKKRGTLEFMSKVSSNSEFYKSEEEEEKK